MALGLIFVGKAVQYRDKTAIYMGRDEFDQSRSRLLATLIFDIEWSHLCQLVEIRNKILCTAKRVATDAPIEIALFVWERLPKRKKLCKVTLARWRVGPLAQQFPFLWTNGVDQSLQRFGIDRIELDVT